MPLQLWRTNGTGEIKVDSLGRPIYCPQCPCIGFPPPASSNACYLAIKERQQAAGITHAWDAGNPANPAYLIDTSGTTVYTLAQLKAYVNQLSTLFIDGLYVGGASLPTLLAANYADAADTIDELCYLVLLMLTTKTTTYSCTTNVCEGQAVDIYPLFQDMIGECAATFSCDSWNGLGMLVAGAGWEGSFTGYWSGQADSWSNIISATLLPSALTKNSRFFGYATEGGLGTVMGLSGGEDEIFNSQNTTIEGGGPVVNREYNLIEEKAVGLNATLAFDSWPSNAFPPNWLTEYDTPFVYGFRISAIFFLHDWNFIYA